MEITIKNPAEDSYGNSKENIFLAFGEEGSYLGSIYAFANTNHSQIEEIPYLIFLDVNVEEDLDKPVKEKVRQELFKKVILRAMEMRKERPDLNARAYTGFEYDRDKMEFYLENGFEEDYTIIMKAGVEEDFIYELPEEVEVWEMDINDDKEISEYKKLYDGIFVSPLDRDVLKEQRGYNFFKHLYFYTEGRKFGGCTIFEKDGFGYINTFYVLPEFRRRGLSKIIIQYILNYFSLNGLTELMLEVWALSKPAVKLYEYFGYVEIEKHRMFPGVNI